MSVLQFGFQQSPPTAPVGAPGSAAPAPGADAGLPPALLAALLGNTGGGLQGPPNDVADLGVAKAGQPPAEGQNPEQAAPPVFGEGPNPFADADGFLNKLTGGNKPGQAPEQAGPPADGPAPDPQAQQGPPLGFPSEAAGVLPGPAPQQQPLPPAIPA